MQFACFSQLTLSAYDVSLGRGYLFIQPVADGERVIFAVLLGAASGAKMTCLTFKEIFFLLSKF